jgi:hypothetical protein
MNKLMCLTDQGPRPRLDIPLYIYPATVEFGSLDHTVVTWPNALGNRGGAELTIDSVVLADADNGTIPPPSAALSIVDIDRIEYMEHLADKFAGQSAMFRETLSNELSINDVINGVSSSRNNAAYALPSWVYTSTLTPTPGTVIPAPGDYLNDSIYIDITVEVNGTMVPRGEAVMFAYIYSDDPDYFLDSAMGALPDTVAHQVPVIQLSIVGGCLYDDVLMSFGAGGANTALIWNASKICDGDLSNSIEIDGDHASMWNGAFVFATDDPSTPPPGKPAFFSKRVAMYLDNWSAAYPATWQSALADVNCITGFCPPEHTTNVLLGTFSHDMGANYDDVMGDVVTYAMVDSVQDMCEYDTLANCLSWNWDWARGDQYGVQPPYDQTLTMGWHACVTVIGAQDEPELANFFIEKFEFDGRYGDVPNVWMGAILDVDIDGMDNNVAGYDEDLSAAWAYECNAPTNAWGMVKIPFGCDGETPLVNAKTLTANMAGWNDTSVWIDSLYYWMSSLTGLSHQPGTDPVICATDPDDREVFFTVSGFDIPAAPDKHTLGVAIFGLPSVADASDPATFEPLAKMANKWCGFGRGDTDNDNDIDIFDIARTISASMGGDGAYPFDYLADVNADGLINNDDVQILIGIVFFGTGAPAGAWVL